MALLGSFNFEELSKIFTALWNAVSVLFLYIELT